MALIAGVSDQRVSALRKGWELARCDPDLAREPGDLPQLDLAWRQVELPTTVAGALGASPDLDDSDFWFRTRFAAPAGAWSLRFNGLATLSDVWIDGAHALASDDMFVARECDGPVRGREVELALRFRSLKAFLSDRRTRPRWRTRLAHDAELRRVRTTLFGRMPGFAPLVPAIGPWRAVELVEHGALFVLSADARARATPSGGQICVKVVVRTARPIQRATIQVGDHRAELEVCAGASDETTLAGVLELERVERWWPHTHGAQPLYPVTLWVGSGDRTIAIDLGKTGFRSVELDRENGAFRLIVNGVPIFARGACWLPLDPVALDAPRASLERVLGLARAAGMNTLRVTAQGIYESDAFYRRAAELGFLVWQDFQFARLDYPSDPGFCRNVADEARGFLDRTQLCPALGVLCGNSEVEQTVAMSGLDPKLGQSPLFYSLLPELSAATRPDVPYLPSTPSGGALPFHVDAGVAHYFGVGAYLRPLSDARLANVRFAAECLAFSNVPDRALVEELLDGEAPGVAPRWKGGVPRDNGASWDFEDVRDHYLERCFEVDARKLRSIDPERWLELGRVATGEVMATTIAAFRRAEACAGALIWHLKDVVAGAGCGLIDARDQPKAAYWFVARAFRPLALFLNDEGLNGLRARAINDTARAVDAELRVSLYRNGTILVDRGSAPVALPARSAVELSVEGMLGRFVDVTHAYRFGPANHDATAAQLIDLASGAVLAQALHFPGALPSAARSDLVIEASATPHPSGFTLHLSANALAYAVHVEAAGFEPDDDYFHLEPGSARNVVLCARDGATPAARARISAINLASAKLLRLERAPEVKSA